MRFRVVQTLHFNLIKMQFTVAVLAALVCVVTAQWWRSEDSLCKQDVMMCRGNPRGWFSLNAAGSKPGQITWNKPAGNGKVFGTLGSTDQGLFGQAGYKQVVFDDARGKLEAQAHGTRVLGPNGDSSHLGGQLEWSNKNAEAAVDVSKQIGGQTSMSASGSGKWHPDKNTEVSAGGSVSSTGHGRPDVAVQAQIEHKF